MAALVMPLQKSDLNRVFVTDNSACSTLLAASAFPLPGDGDHAISSLNRRFVPSMLKIVTPAATKTFEKANQIGPMIFIGTAAFGMKKDPKDSQYTVFYDGNLFGKSESIVSHASAPRFQDKILVLKEKRYIVEISTPNFRNEIISAISKLEPQSPEDFVNKVIDVLFERKCIAEKPTIDPKWYEEETSGPDSHLQQSSHDPASVKQIMGIPNLLNPRPTPGLP
ncbi:hypothetical protein D9757_009013 [Collybiopsis confluens]|uniref:Uncharacterized protein n=1 Tax=Collybiopsis confluens TaxID=2823264 RepID=A0A8H5H313_9AGAR|nr:hypothetical protein D9757_009013 [Collybiopsis confluens]